MANNISLRRWLVFFILAVVFFLVWFRLGYPQFKLIDLSVDKHKAFLIADKYLASLSIDTAKYSHTIVFLDDSLADTFLQKTIGLDSEDGFLKKHDLELFFWEVRFFKPLQKEEYSFKISPKDGRIISFLHLIEDVEPRVALEKEAARQKAEVFLKGIYGFDFTGYVFHEEKIRRLDKRIDYVFSWEKKNVYLEWKKDQGQAKILTGAIVSGDEIRYFYKSVLDVPENFQRYLDKQFKLGELFYNIAYLLFMFLVIASIVIVVRKRQSVNMRLCKNWYVKLAIILGVLNAVYIANNIQNVIHNYPTSSSFFSFMGVYFFRAFMNLIFLSVTLTLPGIAGEALFAQEFPDKEKDSLTHWINSTFLSRRISAKIMLGYLLFIIIMGLQSLIFFLGHQYLGVWKEWVKLSQYSSAYIPFFSAFVMAMTASLNEEIIFRLFGISWAKSFIKNIFLAVFIISLIWGFGHTQYAIFPVWFRGIEVTLMGLLFGYMFVGYGIVPLLVAHYLVDVFWGSAAYILCPSQPYLFLGSLFIFLLPLLFALAAYIKNKPEKEKRIEYILDKFQKYNLGILEVFVSSLKSQGITAQEIRDDLIRYNWDSVLVDLAIRKVFDDV